MPAPWVASYDLPGKAQDLLGLPANNSPVALGPGGRWERDRNGAPVAWRNLDIDMVAMYNHKGGVAKTTDTYSLGWALAQKGHLVVMVDADPQCNLTQLVRGCGAHPKLPRGFMAEHRMPQRLMRIRHFPPPRYAVHAWRGRRCSTQICSRTLGSTMSRSPRSATWATTIASLLKRESTPLDQRRSTHCTLLCRAGSWDAPSGGSSTHAFLSAVCICWLQADTGCLRLTVPPSPDRLPKLLEISPMDMEDPQAANPPVLQVNSPPSDSPENRRVIIQAITPAVCAQLLRSSNVEVPSSWVTRSLFCRAQAAADV